MVSLPATERVLLGPSLKPIIVVTGSLGAQLVEVCRRFGALVSRLAKAGSRHPVWVATLPFLLPACATNPVTGEREFTLMTEAQEIEIGQQLDGEVRREMGEYPDRAVQAYVEEIGLKLARGSHRPNLAWSFVVVDVPAVNAFALPGGYIYLTRGILPYLNDEADLAGVLGHEIGHVTARHAVQAYTRAAGASLGLLLGSIFVPATRPFGDVAETGLGLLFLKYGRDDEIQADRLGAQYLVQSGWDPSGVLSTLTTLARIEETSDRRGIPNWLSTHPNPADRVTKITSTLAELRAPAPGALATNRDEYLRHIGGLVFGDNPAEGIARGSTFVHPVLRFELKFPEGWEIQNSKAQVVARQPGGEIYMLLQLVENSRGRLVSEVAARAMRNAGFARLEGGPTTINGLDAYAGTYQGSVQGLGRVLMRAAHLLHRGEVYVLAGLAQPGVFDGVAPDFSRCIKTFRALSPSEAADVRPNRVDFYVVREGDTWQSIAQRSGESILNASTLAIMNGYEPNVQPRPGERIKIVVGG